MSVIAKYTLPTITGSHADFPLLLKWADFSAEAISSINDGGGNLRFYSDESGSNGLPCEVVQFDKSSSAAQVYVKVPTVSTGIDVYIGTDGSSQPLPGDPLGSRAVWSDYHIASHLTTLEDTPSGVYWTEQTVNADGIAGGINTDGVVGEDYEFLSDDDYLQYTPQPITLGDEFTLQYYFEISDNLPNSNKHVFAISEYGSINSAFSSVIIKTNNTTYKAAVYSKPITSSTAAVINFPNTVVDGDAVLITIRNYADSVEVCAAYPDGTVASMVDSRERYYAGSANDRVYLNSIRGSVVGGRAFTTVDEPRITKSGIMRSDDWIKTEYSNQMSQGAWGAMTAVESAPAQEFTSNAALTLDELSISATMASTVPSFESYAHISLDEPQFQSVSIGSQPETSSSVLFGAGQLSFSLFAENQKPEIISSASLSISGPLFSAQSVPVGIITASTGFEVSSPRISLSMGSAKINTSSGYASIDDASFSAQATSNKPEFESNIEIDSQISISSTANSIPPQFEMYAEMEIDNLSFSTIEPTPQLDTIYVHEDAVITYMPKNNVVKYVPKNNVIRG